MNFFEKAQSFHRVSSKKEYLNTSKSKAKRLTGSEWYMQQAIRAVNQVIFFREENFN